MDQYLSVALGVGDPCPEVSEKPQSPYKGVTLIVKLNIIEHICYDLVGDFGAWEYKIFSV